MNKKGTQLSDKEINDYVKSYVSGIKLPNGFNGYTLSEAGRMIVSFPKFIQMVSSGYNIISADYLGNDNVDIEYQKFMEFNKKKGRQYDFI